MDERKRLILEIIIKEYIATGAPVASSALVEKYKLPVSSATVRNEMAELEEAGWIMQPHTSAGRVPTEKAYTHYISELTETPLPKKESELLREVANPSEVQARRLAKHLANLTGLAVVWADEHNNVYYTGVSHLLDNPEFDVSEIIDDIDEIITNIFESVEFNPQVMIGHASPFGNLSGTILTRYRSNDSTGLIGVVGPMRMDYAINRSRLKYLSDLLSRNF